MTETPENRRPLKSRGTGWAQGLASGLAKAGASPDMISAGSIIFALLGLLAFLYAAGDRPPFHRGALLIGAGVCIQLRLLCNLLDGMVAVEGGRGSRAGEVFNDAPDRAADAIIFIAAGYTLPWPGWGPALGWSAALLAVLTAYVRMLGGALGRPQDFCGPMAKPHRMAVLTIACLASIPELLLSAGRGWMLTLGLAVIVVGSAFTVARRLVRLVRALEVA